MYASNYSCDWFHEYFSNWQDRVRHSFVPTFQVDIPIFSFSVSLSETHTGLCPGPAAGTLTQSFYILQWFCRANASLVSYLWFPCKGGYRKICALRSSLHTVLWESCLTPSYTHSPTLGIVLSWKHNHIPWNVSQWIAIACLGTRSLF